MFISFKVSRPSSLESLLLDDPLTATVIESAKSQ